MCTCGRQHPACIHSNIHRRRTPRQSTTHCGASVGPCACVVLVLPYATWVRVGVRVTLICTVCSTGAVHQHLLLFRRPISAFQGCYPAVCAACDRTPPVYSAKNVCQATDFQLISVTFGIVRVNFNPECLISFLPEARLRVPVADGLREYLLIAWSRPIGLVTFAPTYGLLHPQRGLS